MFFNEIMVQDRNLRQAWRAGHHQPLPESSETCLPEMCDTIQKYVGSTSNNPLKRMSLRSSTVLVDGAAKIYKQNVDDLLKDMEEFNLKMIKRRRTAEGREVKLSSPVTPEPHLSPEQMHQGPSGSPVSSEPHSPPEQMMRQQLPLEMLETSFAIPRKISQASVETPIRDPSLMPINESPEDETPSREESSHEDSIRQFLPSVDSEVLDTSDEIHRKKRRSSFYIPRSDSSGTFRAIEEYTDENAYQQTAQQDMSDKPEKSYTSIAIRIQKRNSISNSLETRAQSSSDREGSDRPRTQLPQPTPDQTVTEKTSPPKKKDRKDTSLPKKKGGEHQTRVQAKSSETPRKTKLKVVKFVVAESHSTEDDLDEAITESDGSEDSNLSPNITKRVLYVLHCSDSTSSGGVVSNVHVPKRENKETQTDVLQTRDIGVEASMLLQQTDTIETRDIGVDTSTLPRKKKTPRFNKREPFASIMLYDNPNTGVPTNIMFGSLSREQMEVMNII